MAILSRMTSSNTEVRADRIDAGVLCGDAWLADRLEAAGVATIGQLVDHVNSLWCQARSTGCRRFRTRSAPTARKQSASCFGRSWCAPRSRKR